jgi:hypothetical protein
MDKEAEPVIAPQSPDTLVGTTKDESRKGCCVDKKIKHLEMIEAVVNRMAGNSFLIKGWCVTIVSALLALSSKDANKYFVVVAYYPVLMFWIMDGYFLWQERLFRGLYDEIRVAADAAVSFSMDTSHLKKKISWIAAFFSLTLSLFYATMILAILIVYQILFGSI